MLQEDRSIRRLQPSSFSMASNFKGCKVTHMHQNSILLRPETGRPIHTNKPTRIKRIPRIYFMNLCFGSHPILFVQQEYLSPGFAPGSSELFRPGM